MEISNGVDVDEKLIPLYFRDKEQITLLNNQLMESNKANESLRNELAICDSVIKLSQKSNREGM
jgi:hypothetical protein